MEKHVGFYVNLTDNENGSIDKVITVEHRSNNPKRDFLFVNRVQGKHIPCNPNDAVEIFNKLSNVVTSGIPKEAKVLVIGFAETATAIGSAVAYALGNRCVYRTQTTRCIVDGESKLIEFEEEHSHATQQYLYGKWENIPKFDYILFVEDEISTGKTILNFIDKLSEKFQNMKFGVASICNWQSDKNKKIYADKNIDTFAIFRGELKDSNIKMDATVVNSNSWCEDVGRCQEIDIQIDGFFKSERSGCIPSTIKHDTIIDEIVNKITRNSGIEFCHSICIIGTEENMYYPIMVAHRLSSITGKRVYTHSTTRSPIDVCIDNTDISSEIVNKSRLSSPYGGYDTYIYNLRQYDKIFIITDAEETSQFNSDICKALHKYENDTQDIRIIKIRS